MAAHRFWRIWITETDYGPGGWVTVGDLAFAETPDGPTICVGGTSIAKNGAARLGQAQALRDANTDSAFDGSPQTEWLDRGGVPTWVGYDLGPGNARDVVEMRLMVGTSVRDSPRRFWLEYSDDGEAWFRVGTETICVPVVPYGSVHKFHGGMSGRGTYYWGLRIESVGGAASWARLGELEFRGEPGGPSLSVGGSAMAQDGQFAFDGNLDTYWPAKDGFNTRLIYACPEHADVNAIALAPPRGTPAGDEPARYIVDRWDSDAGVWISEWYGECPGLVSGVMAEYARPPGGVHKFWRVYYAATWGDPPQLWECSMRGSVGGAELARGGRAFARNAAGSFPADNAFDGSTDTRWIDGTYASDTWIGYEFAEPVHVAEVAMFGVDTPRQMIRTGALQYSDDGEVWASEFPIDAPYLSPPERLVYFADEGAAYGSMWRILPDGPLPIGRVLGELELRGVPGGPSLTTGGRPWDGGFLPPTAAFDGNPDTIWVSNQNPGYLGYRFAEPVDIWEVAIWPQPNGSNNGEGGYTLQVSDTGRVWEDVFHFVAEPWPVTNYPQIFTRPPAGNTITAAAAIDAAAGVRASGLVAAAARVTGAASIAASAGVRASGLVAGEGFPALPHRAWRVRIDATQGGGPARISTLILADQIGGPSIATGGLAIATGSDIHFPPGQAFDGTDATAWRSPPALLGFGAGPFGAGAFGWTRAPGAAPLPAAIGYDLGDGRRRGFGMGPYGAGKFGTPRPVDPASARAAKVYEFRISAPIAAEAPIAGRLQWSDTDGPDDEARTWHDDFAFSAEGWVDGESRTFRRPAGEQTTHASIAARAGLVAAGTVQSFVRQVNAAARVQAAGGVQGAGLVIEPTEIPGRARIASQAALRASARVAFLPGLVDAAARLVAVSSARAAGRVTFHPTLVRAGAVVTARSSARAAGQVELQPHLVPAHARLVAASAVRADGLVVLEPGKVTGRARLAARSTVQAEGFARRPNEIPAAAAIAASSSARAAGQVIHPTEIAAAAAIDAAARLIAAGQVIHPTLVPAGAVLAASSSARAAGEVVAGASLVRGRARLVALSGFQVSPAITYGEQLTIAARSRLRAVPTIRSAAWPVLPPDLPPAWAPGEPSPPGWLYPIRPPPGWAVTQ